MFIDETIKLRDDLPERLQRDFAELREYYDAGDWFNFDIFFEGVEATVKGYFLAGKNKIYAIGHQSYGWCLFANPFLKLTFKT